MNTWWNRVKESLKIIQKPPRTMQERRDASQGHLANQLTQFRFQVEGEANTSIVNIDTNLALALYDMCQFIELDQAQTRQVLGPDAYTYVYETPAIELPDEWAKEYQAKAIRRQRLFAQLNELDSVKAGATWSPGN